mmetsp:Transcript_26791/g.44000  ORF Transcript_26791/g.44000 Transcript_26791/m.44000 type:complete len:91 (+) Transcript_26791:424-696(+)
MQRENRWPRRRVNDIKPFEIQFSNGASLSCDIQWYYMAIILETRDEVTVVEVVVERRIRSLVKRTCQRRCASFVVVHLRGESSGRYVGMR